MTPILEIKDLVYEYPNKRALHGISFSVEPGSVVALVGPNGAGKTTLLRCLAALERPFSGTVCVAGIDTQTDPRAVHQQVAYLADFYGLYDGLTVRQSLLHMAAIHGVAKQKTETVIEEISSDLDLAKLQSSKSANLSRGQRQRLAIAMAIIHKPPVLLLDEPAAGLDPEARHALSVLISSLRVRGMTLVVSSHILSELEDYSTEMLTIQDGRIIGYGGLHDLTTDQPRRTIRVKCLQAHADVLGALREIALVRDVKTSNGDISFVLEGGPEVHHEVLTTIVSKNVGIYSFSVEDPSLQEIYLTQIKDTNRI
jgi:ABC-2 type transport system ATP-binding protein